MKVLIQAHISETALAVRIIVGCVMQAMNIGMKIFLVQFHMNNRMFILRKCRLLNFMGWVKTSVILNGICLIDLTLLEKVLIGGFTGQAPSIVGHAI
ncbi:MAG: hypothetical protein CVV36_02505 [Candidatus Methanoperedenaceae archaeon HGW-Methanoperedenaceae-1]|nr:MAG: hypothetical protein CVV36_02505 [Candidatus Methanoperedenaceae archaeon HGW-Methanoperedenaceae-1]